ncbi:MAG TPA: glycoside hydrolase family 15 protein, partial [Acidimicrobiales bacterium]|nr:glycoside hydrolase family 15 protein [Acidimicrobiales bacterium]
VSLAGEDRWCGLVVAAGAAVAFDAGALSAALEGAGEVERRRAATARLPRHHPERASDALAVLAGCTFAETGAVVAAPTTSLPEAPGGDRQWDYRFTWLRDASLAVSVAALLGRGDLAAGYLDFVHAMAGSATVPTGPMTGVRGGEVPAERLVEGVAGWAGSRPVRTGNAAADQVQLDALGFVVEAVSVHVQTGGSLDRATWELVGAIADRAAGDDTEVSNGIWELREPKALVDADLGKWLALDRALWIARGWRPLTRRRRWRRARDRLRERILGAIEDDGLLPQAYGEPGVADAAALLAVVFGLLDRHDPRAARLVDAVIARLDAAPFLYRYEPDGSDGLAGREGAFLPASWWAVAALAAVGRYDDARRRAGDMCRILPRLLSEEIDPEELHCLGNVPLVWSHMEAARTMYLLDAEERRRRTGAAGLWLWRVATFLRMRLRRPPAADPLPTITPG